MMYGVSVLTIGFHDNIRGSFGLYSSRIILLFLNATVT